MKLLVNGFISVQALVCLLCERMKTSDSSVNKNHLSSVHCVAQITCILNNIFRPCINTQCNTKPLISPVLCKKSIKTTVCHHRDWKRRQEQNRKSYPIFTYYFWILESSEEKTRKYLIGVADKYGFGSINYISNG